MLKNQNMTSGKPIKQIVLFSIPLLIGNIFQQLYSMVDTIIVGRTISLSALAAVGATGAISFLVIGFVQGVTSGFTVITAQYYGAGDTEGVKRSVAVSLLLSVAVTIVVTIVAVFTTMPLLKVMNTPSNIIQDAYNYIIVIYYGIWAAVFYNLISGIVRAIGDSRTPLYFLIFASVLNIGLDFLFILVFKMGVAGAGWATVISQAAAGVLCLIFALWKYEILRVKLRHFKFKASFAWKHLVVGLPMALQFSITAVGVMIIQAVLNKFGSNMVGAYTAASKIDMIATQPLVAIGAALATYTAQNYGAGNFDRIKKGMRAGVLLTVLFSIIGLVFIVALKTPLLKLFVGADFVTIQKDANLYLYINAGCYLLLGFVFLYRSTLQGMGSSVITMLAGVSELVMRALTAFLLADALGFMGVCLANPIAWLGADIFLIITYYILIAKKTRGQGLLPPPIALDHAQNK